VIGIEEVRKKYTKSILINMNLDATSEKDAFELIKLIERCKGKCQCFFNLSGSGLINNSIYLTIKFTVDPDRKFTDAIKQLLGQQAVRLRG